MMHNLSTLKGTGSAKSHQKARKDYAVTKSDSSVSGAATTKNSNNKGKNVNQQHCSKDEDSSDDFDLPSTSFMHSKVNKRVLTSLALILSVATCVL